MRISGQREGEWCSSHKGCSPALSVVCTMVYPSTGLSCTVHTVDLRTTVRPKIHVEAMHAYSKTIRVHAETVNAQVTFDMITTHVQIAHAQLPAIGIMAHVNSFSARLKPILIPHTFKDVLCSTKIYSARS